MCIQIICILEMEESVQMSQLRIKEWPTHRRPVTQKKNKRLRAVCKISWTTQLSHRAQTLLDYEWSPFFLRDSRASETQSLPTAFRFSRLGWFSRALTFRSLYYPWGKMGATLSLKYYWPTSFYCTGIQPAPFFLTSPYHGCKQGKNGARGGKRVCEVRFLGMPILLNSILGQLQISWSILLSSAR